MFITNIFLQLIITVSIILILMSRKYYMGLCMLAGGIVLWLMRSGDPFLLATSFVSMLHQTRTYDLIISFITDDFISNTFSFDSLLRYVASKS